MAEREGDGSARRKWVDLMEGWQHWRAEERVPKEQLIEIQPAARVDWRMPWEEVVGASVGVRLVGWWMRQTGRERRLGTVVGLDGGGGLTSEGWEGHEVVN